MTTAILAPTAEDPGGGDIASLEREPSTIDDEPL